MEDTRGDLGGSQDIGSGYENRAERAGLAAFGGTQFSPGQPVGDFATYSSPQGLFGLFGQWGPFANNPYGTFNNVSIGNTLKDLLGLAQIGAAVAGSPLSGAMALGTGLRGFMSRNEGALPAQGGYGGQSFAGVNPAGFASPTTESGIPGVEGPTSYSGGRTVGLNLYAQGPEEITSDAGPIQLPAGYGTTFPVPPGLPLDQALRGGGPTVMPPPQGQLPPSPAQGLPVQPTVDATSAGAPTVTPSIYDRLPIPPEMKARLIQLDQERQQILSMAEKGPSGWQRGLQGLALGIAGAGDVARNLQVDPRTGQPLYAPSAVNMDRVLEQQRAMGAKGEKGEGSRQKMLLDANQNEQKQLMEVAKFAQSADENALKVQKQFMDQAEKLRVEMAEADPARAAAISSSLKQQRAAMGLPEYYDVYASTDKRDLEFTRSLGALGSYLKGGDPREQLSAEGINIAQYRKDPEKALELLRTNLGVYAAQDALQRTRSVVQALKASGKFGEGPLPADLVKDLVVSGAGDKAEAMKLAFEGALFKKEAAEQFNTALGQLGVEQIGEKARRADVVQKRGEKVADERAMIPVEAEKATAMIEPNAKQAAATARALIQPGVEKEEAERPGKLKTREEEKKIDAMFKAPPSPESSANFRKEFTEQSKNFTVARESYERIQSASDNPAGHMALIYGFMKMQDPTSAVRETEYATASNAAGVSERVRNLWNKLVDGDTLTPAQFARFKDEAATQFRISVRNQLGREKEWSRLAKENDHNPAGVIVDLIGPHRVDPAAEAELKRRKAGGK